MIFEWLFGVVLDVLDAVLAVLPEPPTPPDISSWVTSGQPVIGVARWLSWYLPVGEAVSAIVIVMLVGLGVHVGRFIIWALSKAHLLGGGSQ